MKLIKVDQTNVGKRAIPERRGIVEQGSPGSHTAGGQLLASSRRESFSGASCHLDVRILAMHFFLLQELATEGVLADPCTTVRNRG